MIERYTAYEEKREDPVVIQDENVETIFDIFTAYMEQVLSIGDSIVWAKALSSSNRDQNDPNDNTTVLVFGESGSGKSSLLTLSSQIYFVKQMLEAGEEEPIEFVSSRDTRAVTKQVKIETMGNFLMIDCPGTNDADKKRTDAQIFSEVVNTVRPILTSST